MTNWPRAAPVADAALIAFRTGLYGCFTRWADALFELCDAVLCSPAPVGSVPALSLEPVFRRSHGSLYKALARGRIDTERLGSALLAHRPADWPPVFAVDASTWARCDAETSPERGFYYSASKHSAGQPIVAGWSYQWITQLDWAPDSWTAPLDALRIPPRADAATATIAQVQRLVGRLGDDGDVPMFVFDAGYDPIALGAGLADTRAAILVRIRADRVFYPDPAPRTRPHRRTAAPARHPVRPRRTRPAGARPTPSAPPTTRVTARSRSRPGTACTPSSTAADAGPAHDAPPIVRGTVIRVEVEHLPKPTARALKTLWLWWSGPGEPDLDLCWRAYLRRFDIEHTFRFVKNTLGWTTPGAADPRTSRPLDLARRRRLHPAPPRPRPRRRPTPALGTTPRPRQAHPRARPPRVSSTSRHHRHPGQSTEIQHARPRTTQRAPDDRHEPATQPSRRPPDEGLIAS